MNKRLLCCFLAPSVAIDTLMQCDCFSYGGGLPFLSKKFCIILFEILKLCYFIIDSILHSNPFQSEILIFNSGNILIIIFLIISHLFFSFWNSFDTSMCCITISCLFLQFSPPLCVLSCLFHFLLR